MGFSKGSAGFYTWGGGHKVTVSQQRALMAEVANGTLGAPHSTQPAGQEGGGSSPLLCNEGAGLGEKQRLLPTPTVLRVSVTSLLPPLPHLPQCHSTELTVFQSTPGPRLALAQRPEITMRSERQPKFPVTPLQQLH